MAENADRFPITVLLPGGSEDGEVMEIVDDLAALRIAVVERKAVRELAREEWESPGVYILLDRPDNDGSWGAYVGKAIRLRDRVLQHDGQKTKSQWYRALIVRRDTTHGFTSTHIGWLEGRVHDLLDNAVAANLHNRERPDDETMPHHEIVWLDNVIEPVRRVLRMFGHDTASQDEDRTDTKSGGRTRVPGTLKELAENHLLCEGESLVSTNRRWPANALVMPKGRIRFGDDVFDNPSAAAKKAKNGGAANGWDFWAVQRDSGRVSLATLRAKLPESGSGT